MAPLVNQEDVETIDHQFDEVLKFLADSINGDKYDEGVCNPERSVSAHQSSSSSPSFIISDHGSGSSSGIGEDFYPDCHRIKDIQTQKLTNKKKRASTDSDYTDSISNPSSVKNLTVNENHQAVNSSGGESSEPSPVQKDVDPV